MIRVLLSCCESESDITSRWVNRESNLMSILSSDKDQRIEIAFTFAFAQRKLTLNRERKQQHSETYLECKLV